MKSDGELGQVAIEMLKITNCVLNLIVLGLKILYLTS